jgi:hypothetical protein
MILTFECDPEPTFVTIIVDVARNGTTIRLLPKAETPKMSVRNDSGGPREWGSAAKLFVLAGARATPRSIAKQSCRRGRAIAIRRTVSLPSPMPAIHDFL